MKKRGIWSFYWGFGGKWRRKNTMHKQNPYSFLFGIRIWNGEREGKKVIRQIEGKNIRCDEYSKFMFRLFATCFRKHKKDFTFCNMSMEMLKCNWMMDNLYVYLLLLMIKRKAQECALTWSCKFLFSILKGKQFWSNSPEWGQVLVQ